jgi:signal transduction histidine kinase
MTHEIRTPLNAIVGFSDLLQAMDDQPEQKRELIRIIHNNCDMLLRLINDILVLSSVDSTGLELIPERVDFSKEFDVICQSLEQRVDNPNVEFQKENPLPSLMVTIDNGRIQQVITNFVTNAVKNTQQGYIRVGYRVDETADGRSIYLYCKDTGSGIPEDEQARIFERFVKLNDFVQGTGLGLSICKAIIEKCGGEIGVESEIGKGSTFWFRIPI